MGLGRFTPIVSSPWNLILYVIYCSNHQQHRLYKLINLFCYAVWIWLGEGKAVGSKVFLWQHFGVVGDCHHIVYTIWGCNLFKTLITSSFLGFFLFPNFIRASVGSHFIKIMNIVPDYYKYNFQTRLYIGLSPEHYISYMLR